MPKATSKEVVEVSNRESRLQKILGGEMVSAIQKEYGKDILVRASQQKQMSIRRIPSGIFQLDLALGGGFPIGRINTLFGPKSGCKTTIVLRAIGNAQKMCANCWTFPDENGKCSCGSFRETIAAYLDVEGVWNDAWAKVQGVDIDHLLFSQPDFGEQALDIAEGLLKSGELDILAIDSLAMLTPSSEVQGAMGDASVGTQARMLGKAMRKFTSALNDAGNTSGRRPTIFFTNQIRFKVGVFFGNPETVSGGMAPGFTASTETRLSPGQYHFEKDEEKESGMKQPVYADMRFKVEKNKTYVAHMEGEYRLNLVDTEVKKMGDVIDEPFMVKQAKRVGLIEKKGGSNHCLGKEFDTESQIEKALMTDPAFKKVMRESLLSVLLV